MLAEFADTEVGRTQIDWDLQPPTVKAPTRKFRTWVSISLGLVLFLSGWGVADVLLEDAPSQTREPDTLTTQTLAQRFGAGPQVDWRCGKGKHFRFAVSSPIRARVLLRYASADLSEGEVEVTLNGVSQGFLPADAPGTPRPLLLASGDVRWGELNDLVFTQTAMTNLSGQERWMISDLRIELVPVPEGPSSQLLRLAERSVRQAEQWLEQRDAGEENLFRAWKGFRWVWVLLQTVDPKPELYWVTRSRMDELTQALDQQCSRSMLAVQQAKEARNPRKARQLMEDVLRHFPGTEHPCHNQVLERFEEGLTR